MRRVDGKEVMKVRGGVVCEHRFGSKYVLSEQNHERHLWLLRFICQTCCGAVMETVGEEVATPGDHHGFLINILLSSFSSLSSDITGGTKPTAFQLSLFFSTTVSLLLFWSCGHLFHFANSSLS